jgi:indole-3-glycerol phosphate synthase
MDILEKIVAHKRQEVADRQVVSPVVELEKSPLFGRETVSMVEHLRRPDKSGIIAEFKRKSPSKGIINAEATVADVTTGYFQAGASGLSVLTDTEFFGGFSADLIEARAHNACPILRKDFIIDEYQIVEAKSMGADMVLLIARILTNQEIDRFALLARQLGMEVLLEIHNEDELAKISPNVQIVGVNNRNLATFETRIDTSKKLAEKISNEFLKMSESGIHSAEVIEDLRSYGFEGFLIGERFMQSAQPGEACRVFIQTLKAKQ